ncbi:hypothetical protein Peur_010210 [Populus x canadensis]
MLMTYWNMFLAASRRGNKQVNLSILRGLLVERWWISETRNVQPFPCKWCQQT